MKISELPTPLRVLAEKRREDRLRWSNKDDICEAFAWYETEEGESFWGYLYVYPTYPEAFAAADNETKAKLRKANRYLIKAEIEQL